MFVIFRYKTPLLRGTIDPSIDKFQTVEELIAFDLEHWLCNLYFEINKLPRLIFIILFLKFVLFNFFVVFNLITC